MNPLSPTERASRAAEFLARLRPSLSLHAVVRLNEPLARKTTMRVGGPADVYIEPASTEDLAAVLRACAECAMDPLVIGRGSNLLVRDGGYEGVVICLAAPAFCQIQVSGNQLRCGAGARLNKVAQAARDNSLSGLEFLEGIPGTVGGALRMNAGAMGSAFFDRVVTVSYMSRSGQVCEAEAAALGARYRSCDFLKENIGLAALLSGEPAPREQVENKMGEFSRKRWASQPAAPSAGCMFKNPTQAPAGRLIDELGLKGTRVGGAFVSMEHGNFLVNDGSACARDVLDLINVVRSRVLSERGVDLETEVRIIGVD